MLVPFLPTINRSGGQTRWYNIIKYLSKNHEITLFSLIKDESERDFIPDLKKYCKKIRVFSRPKSPWTFRNLFLTAVSYFPLLVIRNWSFSEKKAIEEELKNEKYDLIHAETFYVMPHLPKTDVPTVLVEQTIEFMVYKHYVDNEVPMWLRPIYLLDVLKLRFWEIYYWKKANQLVAVSEPDKKFMHNLIPGVDIDIVPNGVDAGHYAQKLYKKLSPQRVMYGVTNFEWLQNVEAVDELINKVWPIIHAELPKVKLWIVGRMIPDRLLKLSQEREDIEITESIEDAREAYQSASIMVTPIRGAGGTRLKVLEAMAAGLPVVSTSVGVAGLNIENGKQAIIEDSAKGLAEETIKLLKDPKKAEQIGLSAQKFVKEYFDWQSIVKLHSHIYPKALGDKNE